MGGRRGYNGGGGGGASYKLRKAAIKMVTAACGSFPRRRTLVDPVAAIDTSILGSSTVFPTKREDISEESKSSIKTSVHSKNLCAICLDPLSYGAGSSSPGQAIFTAQCCHSFHFACISSNVRHGSLTCPICRAHWTQLPRNLNPHCSHSCNQSDPILQILDDSIATFRVHRRSFLRSARYDDDDPIEPDHRPNYSRLDLSLIPIPPTHPSIHFTSYHHPQLSPEHFTLNGHMPYMYPPNKAYLSIKLAQQRALDLVLVASSNGPHLRLLKQSMALVVFSLRPIDRLAIVTYSSAAARVFPLRCMTSYGKRAALQVIDRLFYMGQADPIEGLKKGIKILEDSTHKNPQSCILHLSDNPTRSYHPLNLDVPIPIHRFHVGFGIGTSNGFVMHEFEEFLTRLLSGTIREIQLRIEEEAKIIRLGEVRAGEEKRILLELGDSGHICVGYSYIEGGIDECIRTGEAVVSIEDKSDTSDRADTESAGRDATIGRGGSGRSSSVESWDYHDPFMARRWAKHLQGYRL